MKVVILAGGYGTRLAEETEARPKPMVEIGGFPILWHLCKHYAHHGFKEFALALGYKSEVVKRFFVEYLNLAGSLTVNLERGELLQHEPHREDWTVHCMETGLNTNTGGRVKRLHRLIGNQAFLLTYGDGVSDVDLKALLEFHRKTGAVATITAVRPPARFGGLELDGDRVRLFAEKPQIGEGWINGGYMVLEPAIFDYLPDDDTNLESVALTRLAGEGKLAAYRHEGFWQCMDTLRDKRYLESLWAGGKAPWKVWT